MAAVLCMSPANARAEADLNVSPLTWNVIGLDSNNVNAGPNRFPVGARVCNTGDEPATGLAGTFKWDTTSPYLSLRPGSLATLLVPVLGPGACTDLYYEVEVARNAASYGKSARYHVEVTSTEPEIVLRTPRPRELYVERLVSQARNSISDVQFGTTIGGLASVPPGGAMTLLVGGTYFIRLVGATATNGYEQLQSFINFPNTVFQVLGVSTTYSAVPPPANVPPPYDRLYADACRWVNDPNSPNYRSCSSTGKAGGSVTVTYQVRILAVGATNPEPLSTLIYDFSGASYHYNSDYGISTRIADVVPPASVGIAKSFVPASITPGGTSTLTIRLTNPGASPVSGAAFTDTFPDGLVLAPGPVSSTSGCGSPSLVLDPGSLSFSGGTIAPGGVCTVRVDVTAAAAGTYTNTTGNLFIDGTTDTGNSATADLGVSPVLVQCTDGTMARWTIPNGTTANPPDLAGGLPTLKAANVLTAAASAFSPVRTAIRTNLGQNDTTSWETWGYSTAGQYLQFVVDTKSYSQVSMSFWVRRDTPGPSQIVLSYDAGAGFTPIRTINSPATAFTQHVVDFTGLTSTTGVTTFRLTATGANNNNQGAGLEYDDVLFTGCSYTPPPTLSKSFSPDPTLLGGTSTLTFTVSNTALAPYPAGPLTGVSFTDSLPFGLEVANPPAAVTTCAGGTVSAEPGGSDISLADASMPAASTCTVTVSVAGVAPGTFENVSGFIGSNESGPNVTPSGFGIDTLTVVAPPILSKAFGTTTILTGGTTSLSFLVTNPNPATTLTGIAFTDVLPAGLTVATASVPACGGTLDTAAPGTVSLAGGSLGAGASCTFSVVVTGVTAGTKVNTTGPVTSTEGGVGNTASATLFVADPTPALSALKQVGPGPAGPWTSFLTIPAGLPVYYRISVENVGDVDLADLDVSDPDVSLASCSWPLILPVADALDDDHIATCIVGPVTSATGLHSNTATATATWLDDEVTDSSTATYGTPGLGLQKSATESSFLTAGDELHYTYEVTNIGFAPLPGPVSVTDDKAVVTCPAVTTVGDLDDFLDPGESLACTAIYVVTPTDVAAGLVTNVATASAEGVDSPPASATVPRLQLADLSVTKSDGSATYVPGGSTTYTIVVSNAGPSDVVGATVSDPLPAGISSASWTCVASPGSACTAAGSGAIADSVSLLAGGSATYSLTLTIPPGFSGDLVNTVSVAPPAGVTDPVPGNDTATDTDTQASSADLSVTKSDGSATYVPGGSTTYTIVVSNAGPSDVVGATVSDPLPAGISSASWTCVASPGSACTAAGSGAIADSVSLLAGGSATYSLTLTIPPAFSGDLVNTVSVAPPAGVTDPVPGNDTATDTDTQASSADLVLTKVSSASVVEVGVDFEYRITVQNVGDGDATNVVITDPLPTGLVLVSVGASQGSCSGTSTVTCALGTLTPTSVAEVILTVRVVTSGSFANTASATLDQGDPTPLNNTDTSTVTARSPVVIPTASGAGIAVFALLLAASGLILARRAPISG
jgi:uncharacterized repeat protein (TIGR01451 family)